MNRETAIFLPYYYDFSILIDKSISVYCNVSKASIFVYMSHVPEKYVEEENPQNFCRLEGQLQLRKGFGRY